jgi:hypothetical protein
MGFVGKSESKFWLLDKPPGTFLIRFSESKVGVSVVWKNYDKKADDNIPWPASELLKVPLTERLFDPNCKPLTHLYPDVPKWVAFDPFKTPPPKGTDGYPLAEITPRYSQTLDQTQVGSVSSSGAGGSEAQRVSFVYDLMETGVHESVDPQVTGSEQEASLYSNPMYGNEEMDLIFSILPNIEEMYQV